ncbi:fimbria/pilus outer membrane usher protein, partial [Acinetobacter puyangensis]|uniref:fimbria/pilus outer membrane usher protein n=1 Tax=Acinetobacter puyangensis TaxID=1096779 RepID=UPI003A4E5E6F
MNSAFLNYNLSAYDSQFENNNTKSSFFSVNSGINLWGWFFRHNGNYSYYNDKYNSKHSYHNMNTYLLKDISSLSSKLIIGQSNTSGRVFDSINYTGISLSSDDAMLPESLRGFAPVVRGIAQTNAGVTIRQKNSIIYETTVPPGEFVIRDLFPTSYGGDLQVVVREANGFESSFIVPFASVVDMLRPNAYKYEVVAGSYRNENIKDGQPFYQLTYQRGLSNFMTLYGGSQQSDYYGSYLLGSAFNFPFGAFAVDVTHSGTHGLEDNLTGQSYRLSFNKRINKTHSDITLVGYKLSTENYLDFDNAMLYQEQLKNGYTLSTDSFLRPKNRYTLSLNQNLGAEYGQLYISGLYENYWNSSHTGKQIQFGYSNAWRRLFYSLNVSRYSNQFNNNDYSYMLTLNIPLGKETKGALTSSLGRNTSGDWYEQLMLSGSSGKNNRLGWSVTTNKTEGELLNATLSGNYTSPFTTLVGSSSVNGDARTISAGASGAIVVHPLGVTFSPYSSNGYIIAHAEQAKGVEISSYPHLKLDFLGNAAIPVGSPYQKNTVSLDPKNLSNNIELKSSSKDVYPRSGAVVLAEFDTKVGYPLLLKPIHSPSIALGTNVYDGNMNIVGQVGQGGLIYIHPSTVQGILTFSNSSAQESICTIKYDIHDQIKIDSTSSLYISNYSCE